VEWHLHLHLSLKLHLSPPLLRLRLHLRWKLPLRLKLLRPKLLRPRLPRPRLPRPKLLRLKPPRPKLPKRNLLRLKPLPKPRRIPWRHLPLSTLHNPSLLKMKRRLSGQGLPERKNIGLSDGDPNSKLGSKAEWVADLMVRNVSLYER
jgi:hypothetical protein